MKIILLENVKSLGKKGEIKEVAEGYARNFLIAKKLAAVATMGAMKTVQLKKEKEATEKKTELENLKKKALEIKGKKIEIQSRAKNGKLFGSISKKDIASEARAKGIELEEKNIKLNEPIRKTGDYLIQLELAENIESEILLSIKEA